MSNCLIFALIKWYQEGGYLVIRKSRHLRFIPHFIWCKDLKDADIEHYIPENPKPNAFGYVHKLFFKGIIKTNDKES